MYRQSPARSGQADSHLPFAAESCRTALLVALMFGCLSVSSGCVQRVDELPTSSSEDVSADDLIRLREIKSVKVGDKMPAILVESWVGQKGASQTDTQDSIMVVDVWEDL